MPCKRCGQKGLPRGVRRDATPMHIHTVFITYNRLELTQQAIESYFETVTMPHSVVIVDNNSEDGTREWLSEQAETRRFEILLLDENRYPGYAANRGWERAPVDTTHLHRADNDFIFLPGWCEEVAKRFKRPDVAQVGLRTAAEELFALQNVGGNCMITKAVFDEGLRYDETPWTEYPPGWSEDSYFSPEVKKRGYLWLRVRKPCIQPIGFEDPNDEYYIKSWNDRRIERPS